MTTLLCASWIHGTAMQIEQPESVSVWRWGGGITVTGVPGQTNVFHFPIPTPVFFDGERVTVDSVLIRFKTSQQGRIVHVFVNDGERQIANHQHLNITTNPAAPIEERRFGVPGGWMALHGIDIVIHVAFDLGEPKPSFTFESAGCDFVSR
jgi:hypothetical protein